MNKRIITVTSTIVTLVAFAQHVPWQGDKIVIDNPGTYTLTGASTASEVRFNVAATINGADVLTLVAPAKVSGEGELLAPLAGQDGLVVANRKSSSVIPPDTNEFLLWENIGQPNLRNVRADIGGYYVTGDTVSALKTISVAYVENEEGTEASVQLQTASKSWALACKLLLTVRSGSVYGRIAWIRHGTVPGDFSRVGTDWENPEYGDSYGESFSVESICLRNFLLCDNLVLSGQFPSGNLQFDAGTVTVRPPSALTVVNPVVAGTLDALVFKAEKTSCDDDSQPFVTFDLSGSYRFTGSLVLDGIGAKDVTRNIIDPYGSLILTNNASLLCNAEYRENSLAFPDHSEVRVNRGCRLTMASAFIVADSASVVVDGGELVIQGSEYLQALTLANGGCVGGSAYWVVGGNYTGDNYTRTVGEATCVVGVPIRAYNWGSCVHVFETDADLELVGGIGDYGLRGTKWLKRGPAKLYLKGTGLGAAGTYTPASGAIIIEDGAFVLACESALSCTNDITLAGGSLEIGSCANRLGSLTLTGDSSLAVGTGSVTFSDSSVAVWNGKLSITGETDTLETGHVRFLGAGLSPEQLGSMRYNGKQRLALDAEGWLTSYRPGLMLTIR